MTDKERFVRMGKKSAAGKDMRALGAKGGKKTAESVDMVALGARGGSAPHQSRGRQLVAKPCRRCGLMCDSARAAWNHCAGGPKKKPGPKPKAKEQEQQQGQEQEQ